MQVAMIAAMANNRVIGSDNKMPWHLPADLKHFKRVTMGKPVIMGRKTYQSIGKALHIVITTQTQFSLPDAVVVHSAEDALMQASQHFEKQPIVSHDRDEVMIIGGGEIYRKFLPIAETLYLTFIELDVEGDTTFPDYESVARWDVSEKLDFPAEQETELSYSFVTLIKT